MIEMSIDVLLIVLMYRTMERRCGEDDDSETSSAL